MMFKYRKINQKYYESHSLALKEIQSRSRVLDLGCATGYIARELQKKNCIIWGVEINKNAANIAKKYLKKIYNGDLKDIDKFGLKRRFFDYAVLLDVIEHIVDIEPVLKSIKKYIKKNGKIIISTPNIAHISPRLSLFFGNFNYTDTGIMDKTHVHFYTRKTLTELFKKIGFEILKIEYSSDLGQIPFLGKFLKYLPKRIQYNITKLFPTIFGVQFVVICQSL